VQGQAELLKMVLALDATGSFADFLDGRQQQADQHGDNRDDDEQLDEGETVTHMSHGSDSGETGKDEDTGTSIIRGFVGASKILVALVGLALAVGCGPKSPIEGKSAAELEAMLRGGDVTAQAQGALGLSKLGPE